MVLYKEFHVKKYEKKVISLGVPQFCLKSYIGAAAHLILKLHLAELNYFCKRLVVSSI